MQRELLWRKGFLNFPAGNCYFRFLQQRWQAWVVWPHWETAPASWTELTPTSGDGVTTQGWLQHLSGYSQDSPQTPGKQRSAWTSFKSSQSPVSTDMDWKIRLCWIQTCHRHPQLFQLRKYWKTNNSSLFGYVFDLCKWKVKNHQEAKMKGFELPALWISAWCLGEIKSLNSNAWEMGLSFDWKILSLISSQ